MSRRVSGGVDALRDVLAAELPITESMGITVFGRDARGLTLRLPLAANRNHKGTVFAGSLNAAATLAGWGMLWLALADAGLDAHVVIQDSTIEYRRPARTDVVARCLPVAGEVMERTLAQLGQRGRARLEVSVSVEDLEGGEVARFLGRYVLHRRDLYTVE